MIKLEAWEAKNVEKDHCVETFEFCCWSCLSDWLNTHALYTCKYRKREVQMDNKTEIMSIINSMINERRLGIDYKTYAVQTALRNEIELLELVRKRINEEIKNEKTNSLL